MDALKNESTIPTTNSGAAAAGAGSEQTTELKAEPADVTGGVDSPGAEAAPTSKALVAWRRGAAALRAHPQGLMVASVIVAGACGAIFGAMATRTFNVIGSQADVAEALPAADVSALVASLAQLKSDVAALKAASDSTNRNAGAQLARISERIERLDKGQAEPAAKLTKIAEVLERLDQRAGTITTVPKDITGSVTPRPTVAQLPPEPPRPTILEGWRVRSVYDGAALLQGRNGLIEVEPGDTLPGGGRVERIGRQNGRWVVETTKGLITSMR